MISRSNTRLVLVRKMVSEILDIDENTAREFIKNTRVGLAIIRRNQVVLHDQATANVYDILTELSQEMPCKKWTEDDISKAYQRIACQKSSVLNQISVYRIGRISDKQKKALRKKAVCAKRIKANESDNRRVNHRIIEMEKAGRK